MPSRGWFPFTVKEPFSGAWQRNIEWTRETVLAYHAIFACTTLIASDISKLRIKLVRNDKNIWTEIPLTPYQVLEAPNNYQNRIQFFENWLNSKLIRGNAYILKGRNNKGKVTSLHVLNPDMVTPLVSETGEVWYQLGQDNLTKIKMGGVTVPASEIIHDRFNCLYHPLVGLSPIYACGLAAYSGIKIMENNAKLFKNGARPSGILTAPGAISEETAKLLKEQWETNYSGDNYGKTAVLGDDLKYQPLTVTAEEAQMIELLKLDSDIVCSCYHVPSYKVIGTTPSYNNIQALEVAYYSQCLQILIESIELCLDKGLGVTETTGLEFDLDGLLRMDSKTQVDTLSAAVKGGIMPPNKAMNKLNIQSQDGGDTVYLQQQMFSLAALDKRDKQDNPFAKGSTATPATTAAPAQDEERQMLDFALKLRTQLKSMNYDG